MPNYSFDTHTHVRRPGSYSSIKSDAERPLSTALTDCSGRLLTFSRSTFDAP